MQNLTKITALILTDMKIKKYPISYHSAMLKMNMTTIPHSVYTFHPSKSSTVGGFIDRVLASGCHAGSLFLERIDV